MIMLAHKTVVCRKLFWSVVRKWLNCFVFTRIGRYDHYNHNYIINYSVSRTLAPQMVGVGYNHCKMLSTIQPWQCRTMVVTRRANHYSDIIMNAIVSQITDVSIASVCSSVDKKNQRSASLAFARGINRWPANSPHKGQVTRKMFPFHDVIKDTELCV